VAVSRDSFHKLFGLEFGKRPGDLLMDHGKRWIVVLVCAAVVLAAPWLAWAVEEHGGGGGLISIDKSLIIQAINFILLLLVLHRFLYKPLLAKMEERSAAIKKSLDEAQAARAEATRQQEENAARLKTAYAEAASIREQALKEAADEQRRLVEAARAESQRMIETAKAQMEADVRRAREELRREVSDLAVAVAEKLIRKSLRDEDHRRIVDDAIAGIGRG
jgi:F-type H+-transporting ATPase subunit b